MESRCRQKCVHARVRVGKGGRPGERCSTDVLSGGTGRAHWNAGPSSFSTFETAQRDVGVILR